MRVEGTFGTSHDTQRRARTQKLPKILDILQPGAARNFDMMFQAEVDAYLVLDAFQRLVVP